MKRVLLFPLLFCFLFSNIFAQDFLKEAISNPEEILPKAKNIFLSYEEPPKSAYLGELFPIKVKAIIANDDFENIQTNFNNAQNLEIINPKTNWKWFSDNIFYNTFYFKATDKDVKLPQIELAITKNATVIEKEAIQAHELNIIKLNDTQYFSNVIAEDLKVEKYKTSLFDNQNYIIVLEIEAKYANLSDFSLSWVKRGGIDSSTNNLPLHKIFYYAIVPDHTNEFTFSYFDTKKNDFVKKTLPVILDDGQVSTQIGLNPGESSLQPYKNFGYGVVLLILLIMFIRRKRFGYILLIILLGALFLYDKNPFNSIKIQEGAKVKILPTNKSTLFYTTSRVLYAEKIGTRKPYVKILLPNGEIGWIKEEYVIKD